MKNMFEYREGEGIFYRLDPLIKAALLIFFWVVTLYVNLTFLVFSVAAVFIAAFHSGLMKRFLKQTRFFIFFIFPSILVFQVFFHQSAGSENPSLFFFNPSISAEGVVVGVERGLRLFCLLSSSTLFIMTTSPLQLVKRMDGIRLFGFRIPKSVTFFVVFVNRSVTLIFNDFERILDAQKARGFSLHEVGIKQRVTGYTALLTPLLTISLERAQKQAIALELRGFGFKKRDVKRE